MLSITGSVLAFGILAAPTAAQAISYYGTQSARSSAACNAAMKQHKSNEYSITACRLINNDLGIWYFQYGH